MNDTNSRLIKVRFAPSPTGELHLGGARTALYNYLFAKQHGGQVLLRIEDTDQKRFVPGSMDRFFEDLQWLGIEFDDSPFGEAQGKPIIQSNRVERHTEVAHELVKRGAAYYERVDEAAHGQKHGDDEYREGRGVYRGKDRDLQEPPASSTRRVNGHHPTGDPGGLGYVIRLKVPEGKVVLDDVVRGRVEFDLATVDDAVLLKSDGMATYHLAAMVDDHDMAISHILRTEEWLPSSPKHILIFQAMGWEPPQFVHLPLILAADGKKLSKRIHGESVWLRTYRDQGYLPEALVNYLALLGWNPGGDRELMTMDELIAAFSLDRVHKAGAKFDQVKLDAFQSHYVQRMTVDELVERIEDFLESTASPFDFAQDRPTPRHGGEIPPFASGFGVARPALSRPTLEKLVTVTQSRLGRLSEFPALISYFLELPEYDPSLLVFKKSTHNTTVKGLEAARAQLEAAGEETLESEEQLSQLLERVVSTSGLSNGDVFWPVRVALTGQERSPSPAECLWVLGRQESLQRLERALESFRTTNDQ